MKFKRILLVLAILAVLGLVFLLGLNSWVKAGSRPYLRTVQEAADLDADCILVLGCGLQPDGTPSRMLRDRLETGVELYEAGAAPKLLMSGDHSRKDYDEVGTMKKFALEQGIASADIFMDHAGFSTYESMYRARDIFCVKKVVIVSQEYHLYRAIRDARALGLEAWGVAAKEPNYAGQGYREFREVLARAKDVLYGIFQPEPTFLGEEIPITGDGNLSNG